MVVRNGAEMLNPSIWDMGGGIYGGGKGSKSGGFFDGFFNQSKKARKPHFEIEAVLGAGATVPGKKGTIGKPLLSPFE
jgi:hypothetical protein